MAPSKLRSVGVVAHIDAGKTTVSERMLFLSGVEHKVGDVDAGTTVLDWLPEERERGITIASAATHLPWRDTQIQLIDTPGHIDFGLEVERSLRVMDGAVLLIDAVAGVQAQTESVWRQVTSLGLAGVCFVNKLDRPGADFLKALDSVSARLGAPVVPVQYPYWHQGEFVGLVDLIERRLVTTLAPQAQARARVELSEVPSIVADEVDVLRAELLERLNLSPQACSGAIRAALRERTLARQILAALGGCALRDIGVHALLDAIVDYLPAPEERGPLVGSDPQSLERRERSRSAAAATCAFVFKIQADEHADVAWLRVFAGHLQHGQELWNPRGGRTERIGSLWRMHGQARTPLEHAAAGDIVVASGLRHVASGDTLCTVEAPILLEPLTALEPVISLVVELESSLQRDKLRSAMRRLLREDSSLRAQEDESTGQWRLEGMGELHLEVAVQRLRHARGLELRTGRPRVAYRESITRAAHARAVVERTLAGKEIFGALELELRPAAAIGASLGADGVRFAADCRVSGLMRAAVRDALLEGARSGPLLGYPLVDCEVLVSGGESRGPKDSEVAFAQAAGQALREALSRAGVRLLEPRMAVEVRCPREFASAILGDLQARGTQVEHVESMGSLTRVRGHVPLAKMFGYATIVRSLSQGRAEFSLGPAGLIEADSQPSESAGGGA